MNLVGVLEGILFAVGSDGISMENIKKILDVDEKKIMELLNILKEKYESNESGIRITYLAENFKLTTKKEHKDYIKKLVNQREVTVLSPASLEVLAIIAYNQPITRIEVDNLRGVSSVYIIKRLIARNLVEEAGKSTMPGRPNLYKTTKDFLDYLGLATINNLPTIDEIKKEDDKELFTSIYKEEENEMETL